MIDSMQYTVGVRAVARARRAGLLALAVAFAAAGCGDSGGATPAGGGRGGPGGPNAAGGERTVPVEVARAEYRSIARRLNVSGVVEPIRRVGVNSQLSGALLTVHGEEGDRVESGTVLARLDDRELRAQLANAQANYDVAEAALERAERLRDRQVITLPEYERERTAFAAARAQLEQVRTRLDFAEVRAPITGVLEEKQVEAGDVVAPQTRLFTIADVSTMVVRVQVSELDVVQVEQGDAVDVRLDAYPGRTLVGRVRRVFPSADPQTRLVPVEIALTGEDARLARPGFLARATFALGAGEEVVVVPASAVVGTGDARAVFVVEEGLASRRAITVGETADGDVAILSGVRAGETVVSAGANMLRDGASVRVVNAPAGVEASSAGGRAAGEGEEG